MKDAAQSVNEFCAEHGVSRSLFYSLLKRDEAPHIMKVGRRTLISAEAAAEWRKRMEVKSNER
jgi:predicted DNA-binding transcriptional regulator AlpA